MAAVGPQEILAGIGLLISGGAVAGTAAWKLAMKLGRNGKESGQFAGQVTAQIDSLGQKVDEVKESVKSSDVANRASHERIYQELKGTRGDIDKQLRDHDRRITTVETKVGAIERKNG